MGGSKGKKRERSSISSTSNIKSTKKGKKSTDVIAKEESTDAKPKGDLQIENVSAAAKFEAEKAEILESIPQDYRDMFGQICFYPWTKALLPVLIINPFDVPPLPVRQKWMAMYRKKKSRGELDSMSYLVYWYGSDRESDFYSFSNLKQLVLYEVEKKKKKSVYKLSEQIKAKLDSDDELSPKEMETVRRYEEMEEDLLLEPSERKRGVIDFKELHEFDDDEDYDEDVEEQENDLADLHVDLLEDRLTVESQAKPQEGKSKSAAPTKKKRGRPKKIVDENVEAVGTTVLDAIDGVSATGKEPSSKNAKKTKDVRIQKGKKKDNKRLDVDIAEEGTTVAYDETNHDTLDENDLKDTLEETHLSTEKVQLANKDRCLESKRGSTKKLKVESTQSDDEKSLCFALVDDLSSHDEEDDEFPDTRPENKGKQVVSKPKKAKPAKKIQSTKIKTEKPPSVKQLKRKEEEAKKKEEVAFRQCEEIHWDLIRRWKGAIDDRSNVQLQALVLEAINVVESFCVTFIRGYQIGDIIKETRRVLKDAQEDMASYKTLKEKIKTTYARKEIGVPVGFAPTRLRPDLFAVTAIKKPNDEHHGYSIDFSQRSVESMDGTMIRSEIKSPRNGKSSEGDSTERNRVNEAFDQNLVPTKSLARSGSDFSAGAARSERLPKVERKKFTLSTFMRPTSKDEPTNESVAVVEPIEEVVARGQPIIPLWVKGPATIDAPAGYPRSLALEFLVQMAEHLPDGSVDIDSVTRSIETAVFSWAKGLTGSAWANPYWAKIHLVVAAICGKSEKGTIQDLLLQGHFNTPDKLVALAEEKLTASFEGQPVVL